MYIFYVQNVYFKSMVEVHKKYTFKYTTVVL